MNQLIHTIDLKHLDIPRAIASYVIPASEPVMIETGPMNTVEHLVAGLAEIGLAPGDVKHVLVTHIHFDHAGAVGFMAEHGAKIYVHSFGRQHLVDPTRLLASAKRIYGDGMDERWGVFRAVPEDLVIPVDDREVLELGDLRIRALETPGHARHHHAFALELEGEHVAFTGDVAATYLPQAPEFVSIATPPPEFQLGAWLASLNRLADEEFDAIYPTHFGRVDKVGAHLAAVKRVVRQHAAIIEPMVRADLPDEEIRTKYRAWFDAEGRRYNLDAGDYEFYVETLADMNVMGLVRYWRKQAANPS